MVKVRRVREYPCLKKFHGSNVLRHKAENTAVIENFMLCLHKSKS
jgi:hypothetical protein